MTTFIATWSASPGWERVHEDGREEFGVGIFLPPYKVLEKHALAIVNGGLLADRIGGQYAIWEPEDEPLWKAIDNDPGMLKLEQSYTKHMAHKDRFGEIVQRDNMAFMQWSIMWRVAADGDSFGSSAWYMTPSLALAQMIALCEEREREIRSESLMHTGGLA